MNESSLNRTIFVGDTSQRLADQAMAYDPTAFLIDHNNYKEFLDNPQANKTVYTSLGDLPKNLGIFYQLVCSCSKIVYVAPEPCNEQDIDVTDPTGCMQGLTENLLLSISNHRRVDNIEACYLHAEINPLVDFRKSKKSQLWIAGCSFSHGLGVEPNQRYGQLVANSLNLPVSFLTKAGSSIAWAADQILRSNLIKGDTVIWGITETFRMTFIKDKLLHLININTYKKDPELKKSIPLDTLTSENTLYHHLYSIEQVINYCKTSQTNLVLLGLLTSPNMLRYLQSKDNYYHFPYQIDFSNHTLDFTLSDTGSDNIHPGIKQHQQYADFVLEIIKQHSV